MNYIFNSGHRVADLLVASIVIVILAPVLLIVALLARILMGKPVLFRQRRSGLHGIPFTCLKFRTMNEARDAAGNLLPDADRLTGVGNFLRRTSLDELPELWNVLRGDMSVVGPRPLLPEYLPRYTPLQRRRLEVKPGITGWAQVNGRNGLDWEEKFNLDVWYVDHRSLWLDSKILCWTLLKVFERDGISQIGHATMPEFLGTQDGAGAERTRSSI
jgi:sugar transferase EpsL